ncbi:MAG: CHASE domain-containing protein, partial [Myxococcota bacterium]
MSFPRFGSSGRGAGKAALLLLTAMVCLLVTGGILWVLSRDADEDLHRQFSGDTSAIYSVMQHDLRSVSNQLHALQRYFQLDPGLDRERFDHLASIILAGNRGYKAVEWIPQVKYGDRKAFEAAASASWGRTFHIMDRLGDGRSVPAAERRVYNPVYYVEPLAGNETAVGYDLSSNDIRREALEMAVDTGVAAASAPITLVQETAGMTGFLVFVPVFRAGMPLTNAVQRREAILGCVLGVFRAPDLVTNMLASLHTDGLVISLFDRSTDPGDSLIYRFASQPEDAGVTPGLHYLHPDAPTIARQIVFAGRRYNIEVAASQSYISKHYSRAFWITAPAGLFFTLLALLYLNSIARQQERAERIVRQRTAELSDALELNTTMVGSAPIGMLAYNASDGKCLLANESAGRILGLGTDHLRTVDYRTIESWRTTGLLESVERALMSGIPIRNELHATMSGGRELWLSTVCTPFRHANRPHFLLLFDDISDRVRVESENRLNERRLEGLLRIAQYTAGSIVSLMDYALEEAISLTDSRIGYLYYYDEERRLFTLNSWSNEAMKVCSVTEKKTVYELDKTGIWGEAVRQRKPILINDFSAPNPLKKGYPEGHAPLSRFLTVPVFNDGRIVAVAGVANKEALYNDSDVRQLTLLMATVWKIYERKLHEEER